MRKLFATRLIVLALLSTALHLGSGSASVVHAQTLDGRGGGIIAFTSNRDGQSEIYLMNADGSSQTRITWSATDERGPQWSPTGVKLAYRDGTGIYTIGILDLANGIVDTPQLVVSMGGSTHDWTPDGRIVFDSPDSGTWDIYLVDEDGTNLTSISNSLNPKFGPDVSPDGTRVVAVNRNNLWIMDIDGDNAHQLTDTNNDFAPKWSPDGNHIAYVSGTSWMNLEICIIDSDGTNKQWITDSPYLDEFPSWSPDGSRITYENDTGNKEKVFTINVDGSSPTRLTNTDYDDGSPDWCPLPVSAVDDELPQPGDGSLRNYPNPFNGATTISYELAADSRVVLDLYDAHGRRIVVLIDSIQPAGLNSVRWDGRDIRGHRMGSGVYFARLRIDDRIHHETMLYLK